MLLNFKMNDGDICLADCATTHIILRDKRYFFNLTLTNSKVSTISGTSDLIEGSRRANIILPNETRFHINDTLYSRKSTRNLLSFKDIRKNGYCETPRKSNFLKNDKMVISIKIQNFYISRMTKRTSPLESSHKI